MCKRKRLSREERKMEIMGATAELFIEKGFANTTMEDIVARTSLSKGGLYHYYSNTIDILYDLMVEGNKYRLSLIERALDKKDKDISKEDYISFVAEMLVEKIIDDNYYMSIYTIFLQESQRNERLKSLLERLKLESLETYGKLFTNLEVGTRLRLEDNFLVDFVNSLILGCDVLGARENFTQKKKTLVEMLKLYLTDRVD